MMRSQRSRLAVLGDSDIFRECRFDDDMQIGSVNSHRYR